MRDFNQQSLTTQAKKGEQLVSMMPAIKKAFILMEDDIVDLHTENESLKNKIGSYDEKRLEESKTKLLQQIDQTLIFTEKSLFYTILGFTRSQSYPLDDIDGFYQLIAGSYKSDKPYNFNGIDKIQLKCDYLRGSIVNAIKEPILYLFALSSPPGHKKYKEPRIKLFKKINKSVLSQITFYFQDDDHKPVDFNEETISFTCQLIKF